VEEKQVRRRFFLKKYEEQKGIDCLQLKLSVATCRRSKACCSTVVASSLFFFTNDAMAWSPTIYFSNWDIRLRSRRTSSDSSRVAEFKVLSGREEVEGVCSKLFNMHSQKINKGNL
jgi:hypothetical protein